MALKTYYMQLVKMYGTWHCQGSEKITERSHALIESNVNLTCKEKKKAKLMVKFLLQNAIIDEGKLPHFEVCADNARGFSKIGADTDAGYSFMCKLTREAMDCKK